MAIAVLGWRSKNFRRRGRSRAEGSRTACARAISRWPEVTASTRPNPSSAWPSPVVAVDKLKRNDAAEPGCELFLTKPLGVGLVTTAQKRGIAEDADVQRAIDQMIALNQIGSQLSSVPGEGNDRCHRIRPARPPYRTLRR